MTERVAMTCDQIALSRSPTLASQFPVVFANGKRWNEIRTFCKGCEDPLEAHQIHGRVTWPIPSVAVVEGMGHCIFCRLWTPIYIRLRDDMSMDGPAPQNGEWRRWQSRRAGVWPALQRGVARLAGRLSGRR